MGQRVSMAKKAKQAKSRTPFNIIIVGQGGRLQYEAVIFAASLREMSPGFKGRLLVAKPQNGPLWGKDPSIRGDATRDLLEDLGAEIIPFESRHLGSSYPNGNNIEA